MAGYTIYVCDTETTGLDPVSNDVIEVAFWRLSDDEQRTWHLYPLNPEAISDKALQINGHKREDILLKTAMGIERYRAPADVIPEIESWIMTDGVSAQDRVFLGQNPDFDVQFLKALWNKAGSPNTYPFTNFVVDTIDLARLVDLCTGRRRERYNLGSLVKDFGITKQKAHRAAEDVKMTKELFEKIFNPIKDNIADLFKDSYSR